MDEENKTKENKKADKKLLLGIFLALLVAGGAGVYLFMGRSSGGLSPESSTAQKGQTAPLAEKKSLKDLLGLGTSQKCTFTDTVSGSSGTVYVSGNQSRADFVYKLPDATEQISHLITSEDEMYMWTEGETTGFKAKLSEYEQEDSGAPEETEDVEGPSEALNINQQVDYDCQGWTADSAVFALPVGVTFNDLSELMQFNAPEAGETGVLEDSETPAAACSACDSLPAEAQAQCLQALNCE